jgi:glycosyltransferase involved in cell wall biosynthesis
MKREIQMVIVIPVGPSCKLDFITDTIKSIQHFVSEDYILIIADDSQKGTGHLLSKTFPLIHVLENKKNLGKVAGLYITLCNAYRYAIENYDFKVLLKMDDDALIIGEGGEVQAMQFFEKHPEVGMAGRYIKRQVAIDSFGNLHDNYWPRKQIIKDTCTLKMLRRPVANWYFRQLFIRALRNGYELGENIQGGCYFMSFECIRRLNNAGLLPLRLLKNVNFGEDLMFSLLVKSIQMNLGDLGSKPDPIGCCWQGLPASPETLQKEGKKIIHSVRFWDNMSEKDIREFYANVRTGTFEKSYKYSNQVTNEESNSYL